ncbi:unnamed protein product [Paramecium octaurelia]|uniref:Uncharacterized protein n=1 Tax=Paramecium octaurelia TaxID=43137 RepID=A0A8S1WSP9_PAROT|nr:unnamed protein product [Paramecium octaurelia]
MSQQARCFSLSLQFLYNYKIHCNNAFFLINEISSGNQ